MRPDHICIWIVHAPGHPSGSLVIGEFAKALQDALVALGYDAPIVTNAADIQDWAIVICPSLLPYCTDVIPKDKLILFNMEQVQKDSAWFASGAYLNLLKQYPVWDYSEHNITALQSWGLSNTVHCGIGYMPSLSVIEPRYQDIDVLFYGSMNSRRQQLLEALLKRGVHVVAPTLYGEKRNAFIARSKIVLNIHYYEAKLFEIVRASFLLSNRVCIVSESGNDVALEEPYRDGIAFAPYEELVETCMDLLADAPRRAEIAETGFKLFSQQSQAAMVKRALETTFGQLRQ